MADGKTRRIGLTAIGAVIVSGTLAALTPLALKSLVDALVITQNKPGDTWSYVLRCGITYLVLLLAGRMLADIRPLLGNMINQRLQSQLTQRFFDHALRLPMAYLFRRRAGEMIHGLSLGAAGAQLVVTHLVGSVLPVLVELLAMATVLRSIGQAALVMVFASSALAYFSIYYAGARLMKTAANDVSASSIEAHAQLSEGIAHFETLRYFSAEQQASHRLQNANLALERCWSRLNLLNVATALAASATFATSMAACLFIGASAVSARAMSIGSFVLIMAYVLQMVRPLESMGAAARDLSRALGYMRPMLELLAEPISEAVPKAFSPRKTGHRHGRAAALRVEDLHFEYASDKPVIKGLDLDVPAGSTMAIVGRSGSGKSSLARLLMRLYTPQQGRILLGGQPIESMDASELRSAIGLVPQETALLHATIAENIALGTPSASLDDIRIAVRAAQLEAFVDALPLGLDTQVGERGMQLSGGERQRVGIARALLRRPRLYLLDEPTSMLDSKTETEIQKVLRSLSDGATLIVIAHRLSTVVDADEIVVLDDGLIRERGSHAVLLARNGLYAEMWRQQTIGTARPVDAASRRS